MAKTNFEKFCKDKNNLIEIFDNIYACNWCPGEQYCNKFCIEHNTYPSVVGCKEILSEWADAAAEPSFAVKTRANILEYMDKYLRSVEGDEELLEPWLMGGLPDGHTHDEVLEIAEDDDEFRRMVKLFNKLVNY